jgi:hypothetical protein
LSLVFPGGGSSNPVYSANQINALPIYPWIGTTNEIDGINPATSPDHLNKGG